MTLRPKRPRDPAQLAHRDGQKYHGIHVKVRKAREAGQMEHPV